MIFLNTSQPPSVQDAPQVVYKTVHNEMGILQNPTGWFVSSLGNERKASETSKVIKSVLLK